MAKIVGLDLGTNSIGIAVRNEERGNTLKDQLEYFTSVIFDSGARDGELSFASQRTQHRQSRRLYDTRRLRIKATAQLLVEYNLCPLTKEDLERWCLYDKSRGLHREYPIWNAQFEQWVRLDFDGDGVPDYSSPYQIRAELLTKQLNMDRVEDRYMLGRALYHIAQRRGFKSSKGETLKEQENIAEGITTEGQEIDMWNELKKSEAKKSKDLIEYKERHHVETVGQAFAMLEKEGIRIRGSKYQAVRDNYAEEIHKIFEYQEQLSTDSELYKRLISRKRNEGTIFYQKPLRSQKGNVGMCTLETTKRRCPESHPDFELFRAWSFINNIQYRPNTSEHWLPLSINLKKQLYDSLFEGRVKPYFDFSEIRTWLTQRLGIEFQYKGKAGTINYKDNTKVSACPISARLRKILGNDWRNVTIVNQRTSNNGFPYTVTYNFEDLWNLCFQCEKEELEEKVALLPFDEKQRANMYQLWNNINANYANLSLKAIRNINRFLVNGLIYSKAVLLAKIPDIIGKEQWNADEDVIMDELDTLQSLDNDTRFIYKIVNQLIADYKSLDVRDQFAFHNTKYVLTDDDKTKIEDCASSAMGYAKWNSLSQEHRAKLLSEMQRLYQDFFASSKRDYYRIPRIYDNLQSYLCARYPESEAKVKKLYHPSMIEFYEAAKPDDDGFYKLGSPVIGAMKNPMAMRVLHVLRRKMNALIENRIIDDVEDTRIVVETARNLNDANVRSAIATFDEMRTKENEEIAKLLKELFPTRDLSYEDQKLGRYAIEQIAGATDSIIKQKENLYKKSLDERIKKYRLWKEQKFQCIYTGKFISLSQLFDDNCCDKEHTIPRSLSFDDSQANQTVCDSYYNRYIKSNSIPSQLPNYDKDVTINGVTYTAILPRLKPWIDRVNKLRDNVEFWKFQSKIAQDKDRKDQCIQQRHLWQMELDYWQAKVERFTMTEVTSGFRNSQLVDTRIITKYAYHYLRSVFTRVDVQKGTVTSAYRKMLGIQSIDEKKNREQHSHHAIDAATLTVIPVPAKREKMLKLYYEILEGIRGGHDVSAMQNILNRYVEECNIGQDVASIVPYIENNILVQYKHKDKSLIAPEKVERKNGLCSPGDSFRGSLHKETYYGCIMYPDYEEDGMSTILHKDECGRFVYTEGNDYMVVRQCLKDWAKSPSIKKEDDLYGAIETIVDPDVRRTIREEVERRIKNGMTWKEAITTDMWMRNKQGEEIRYGYNRRTRTRDIPLSPIRHVRCKAKSGRGFLSKDKALPISKQLYASSKQLVHLQDRSHKKYRYAQNDVNAAILVYEWSNGTKTDRKFRIISSKELADLSKAGLITSVNSLFAEPEYNHLVKEQKKGATIYMLKAIIQVGTHLLYQGENKLDIREMSSAELAQRLYTIIKFNMTGSEIIYIKHNNDSSDDKPFAITASKFNHLIEGVDFNIDELGNIIFL